MPAGFAQVGIDAKVCDDLRQGAGAAGPGVDRVGAFAGDVVVGVVEGAAVWLHRQAA